MSEEDPFFVVRDGNVWACWLNGTAPVQLGQHDCVRSAMREFLYQPSQAKAEPLVPEVQVVGESPYHAGENGVQSETRQLVEDERLSERHEITILGKIYTTGGSWEVTILDLSQQGCRFRNRDGRLVPDAPLTIKLGPIGPIEAVVRWRRTGEVGAEFKVPLYPSVLDHIRRHFDLRN